MTQERLKIYSRLRAPKAAAIAGIIFAILFVITLLPLLLSSPANLQDVAAWLTTNRNALVLTANLVPFAGLAFLWFVGVLRDHLGGNEDQFFSTVLVGSGLLFLAMLFVATASMGTLILLSSSQPDRATTADLYELGWAFSRNLMYVYAIKMAGVFMISTSSLFLRTGVTPRWMPLLGIGLAAIMIFRLRQIDRVGWIFLFFPLWILLISTYILISHYRNLPDANSN